MLSSGQGLPEAPAGSAGPLPSWAGSWGQQLCPRLALFSGHWLCCCQQGLPQVTLRVSVGTAGVVVVMHCLGLCKLWSVGDFLRALQCPPEYLFPSAMGQGCATDLQLSSSRSADPGCGAAPACWRAAPAVCQHQDRGMRLASILPAPPGLRTGILLWDCHFPGPQSRHLGQLSSLKVARISG